MFETIGYSREYYVDNKLVGTETIPEKDREQVGYYGKITQVADSPIALGKKRIKKGQEYHTILIKLCGRYTSV